jgi:undecaprenyl-diphosphatase
MLNGRAGRMGALDAVMTFAATRLIVVTFSIAAVLVAVELHRRRVRAVAELGAASALAFGVAMLLAHVNHQLRPFQTHHVHLLVAHDPGVSMPSDHAVAAFTLALGTLVFINRRWGIVLTVMAFTIGVGRIWVGVHYPGDILAAAVIAIHAVLEVALWSRWRPPSHRRPAAAEQESHDIADPNLRGDRRRRTGPGGVRSRC